MKNSFCICPKVQRHRVYSSLNLAAERGILGGRFSFNEGICLLGVESTQGQANSALGSQGKKGKKRNTIFSHIKTTCL